MAKYRRAPPAVDAIRWNRHGDHPLAAAHSQSESLHGCGRSYAEHGHLAALDTLVCPGMWIVNDHGVVSLWSDADFHDAFEQGI